MPIAVWASNQCFRVTNYFIVPSCGRLSPPASSISLAAINPGANFVEAEVFGNFIARNYGLGFTRSGFGARSGLKIVFESILVDETLTPEERNKHCENQNFGAHQEDQNGCHCLILRSLVSGSGLNFRGLQLRTFIASSRWPSESGDGFCIADATTFICLITRFSLR
jgi:hypothetical protein